MDRAVDIEIIKNMCFLHCFHGLGFPGMSLGISKGALGHNGGNLGDDQDVLGALVGVNQNSFEHLACLVGAPGVPRSAPEPQNGAKSPMDGVEEATHPRPGNQGMPEAQKPVYT